MNNHRLRALLVRLQDRLSEDDRKRLHFFFGNDVPRRIRDDPTLSGTLSLMESLFDQDKINEEDFTFLINAFDEIQCLDAVKFLREHMKQIRSNGMHESVQSLSLLMPSLIDPLLQDQDDKYSVNTHIIDQTNIYGNNNTIISNKNINDNPTPVIINNQNESFLPLKQKQLLRKSSMTKKWLIKFILLSIILVGLLVGGSIWVIYLKMKDDKNLNRTINSTGITRYLNNSQLKNDNTEVSHLTNVLSSKEQTIKELNKKIKLLEDRQRYVHDNGDRQLFNGTVDASLTHKTEHHQTNYGETTLKDGDGPLQFLFNRFSSIEGWSCVRMWENTAGWHDNHLCTNRDIGLTWNFRQESCHDGRKCVAAVEPADKDWNDNTLCLPGNSSVELIWSYCGPVDGVKCIVLYEDSSGDDFLDNYVCWEEH